MLTRNQLQQAKLEQIDLKESILKYIINYIAEHGRKELAYAVNKSHTWIAQMLELHNK